MRRGRRDRGERTSGPPQLGVFVGLPLACTPSVAAMAENAEGDLNSNLLHASYHTGDPQLDTAIGQWLRWDKVGIMMVSLASFHSSCTSSHSQSALSRPHPVLGRLQRRWFRTPGGAGRCLLPMPVLPPGTV